MITSYGLFCIRLRGILGGIEEEVKRKRKNCDRAAAGNIYLGG
jgi:hypothetical protein